MNKKQVSISLWQQLGYVAQMVKGVREGRSGSALLLQVPLSFRPGVQALSFEVWRNLGRATAIRELLAKKTPKAEVDALLCSALALLVNPDGDTKYDDFTLVNQVVQACKQLYGGSVQANFINGCLRRFLREKEVFSNFDGNLEAQYNHPAWWVKKLQSDWPQDWEAILAQANTHAPMTLRVNQKKIAISAYEAMLKNAGLVYFLLENDAIVLNKGVPVDRLPGFSDGLVSVQDAAAQMAAKLLLRGNTRPKRILDACAAPGGKTSHLFELCENVDVEILALEIEGNRAKKIEENLFRLGFSAEVMVANALEPSEWWDGRLFDAILVDAPCSASGIVRRHPDIRWLRRAEDIAQLAKIQQNMLNVLWPLLAPNGVMLYCTCSIFKDEGEKQTEYFSAMHGDAKIELGSGHMMPKKLSFDLLPNYAQAQQDNDAFYYALFRKIANE